MNNAAKLCAECRRVAEDYLSWRDDRRGVVIVQRDTLGAAGWMDRLRDPHHWEPGVFAVTADGQVYRATGGDAYNGATAWTPIEEGPA